MTDNHKKEHIIWKCDTLWLFMHKCLLECDQWLHKHPPPRKIWDHFLWNFMWFWHQVTKAKWKSFPHSGSACFAVSSFRKIDETVLNSCFLELKLVLSIAKVYCSFARETEWSVLKPLPENWGVGAFKITDHSCSLSRAARCTWVVFKDGS